MAHLRGDMAGTPENYGVPGFLVSFLEVQLSCELRGYIYIYMYDLQPESLGLYPRLVDLMGVSPHGSIQKRSLKCTKETSKCLVLPMVAVHKVKHHFAPTEAVIGCASRCTWCIS